MSVSSQLGDEHEVRLPAGPVRYRERGEGRPVVFVHGFLVNGDLWRGVAPRLADGFRCITPDWPLGSHTAPMQRDADLTPPGLAKLIADFLEALDLRDAGVRRDFGKGFRSASPRHTRAAARALPGWGGPALVVWSTEQTRIYPQRHGRRLAELLGAPLELVDDSYIYVPEDQPARLAEILAGFIRPA